MEREQIIKALECCVKVEDFRDIEICRNCPLHDTQCAILLPQNALDLINSQEQRIKELTEENERLRASSIDYRNIPNIKADVRADTVRKMQELIKERCIKGGIYPAFVARTIDQTAKEMLEGENEN